MRRISRASARKKGNFLQNVVARALAFVTNLGPNDFKSCKRGAKFPDVELSTEARRRCPNHLECKNHRVVEMQKWWRQAEADSAEVSPGCAPVLVFKLHGRSEPLITLSLTDYLDQVYGPLSSAQKERLRQIYQGKKS